MVIFFYTFFNFKRSCEQLLPPAVFSAEAKLVRGGWGMPQKNDTQPSHYVNPT